LKDAATMKDFETEAKQLAEKDYRIKKKYSLRHLNQSISLIKIKLSLVLVNHFSALYSCFLKYNMEANTAIYQTALYVILARKYIFD
jgi:hypothetical protein